MRFHTIRQLWSASFLFVLMILVAEVSWAGRELQVRRDIDVYKSRSRRSRVLTILKPGESVPISKKDYGSWLKVLVYSNGKKQVGYISKASARGSKVRETKSDRSKSTLYKDGIGVGIHGAFAYTQQGEREFDDGDGSTTKIKTLSGTSVFFGIFADFPLSKNFSIRAGLAFRENNMTGEQAISGEDYQTVELSQSFLSLSGLVKYYPSIDGSFWFGGGAELASGQSVELKYADSEDVPVDDDDLPFFMFLNVGTGYDMNIAGNFFLIPDFRVGVVINTSPAIYLVEGNLNVAYRF